MEKRPFVPNVIQKEIMPKSLPPEGVIFEKRITTEVSMQTLLANLQEQYPEATI